MTFPLRARLAASLLLAFGVLITSSPAGAQTAATVTGAVADSSGGVLPGVTVTAHHRATGNTFVAITDELGAFRQIGRAHV